MKEWLMHTNPTAPSHTSSLINKSLRAQGRTDKKETTAKTAKPQKDPRLRRGWMTTDEFVDSIHIEWLMDNSFDQQQ